MIKYLSKSIHAFSSPNFARIYKMPLKEAILAIDQLDSNEEKLALFSIQLSRTSSDPESHQFLSDYIQNQSGKRILEENLKKLDFLDLNGIFDLLTIFHYDLKKEDLRKIAIRLCEFLKKNNEHDLQLKCKCLKIFLDRENFFYDNSPDRPLNFFQPKTIEDFYIKNELEMSVNDKIIVLPYMVRLNPEKHTTIQTLMNDIYQNKNYINGLSFINLIKNTLEMIFNTMMKYKKIEKDDFYLEYFDKLDHLPIVIDLNTPFHPKLFLDTMGIYNALPIVSEVFIKDFFGDNLNKMASQQNYFYSFVHYIEFLDKFLMKHSDMIKGDMVDFHIKNMKQDIFKQDFYVKFLACHIFSIFGNRDYISFQDPIFAELKETLNISINNGELVNLIQQYNYGIVILLNIKKINLDFKPVVERAIETLTVNIPMINGFLKELENNQI